MDDLQEAISDRRTAHCQEKFKLHRSSWQAIASPSNFFPKVIIQGCSTIKERSV